MQAFVVKRTRQQTASRCWHGQQSMRWRVTHQCGPNVGIKWPPCQQWVRMFKQLDENLYRLSFILLLKGEKYFQYNFKYSGLICWMEMTCRRYVWVKVCRDSAVTISAVSVTMVWYRVSESLSCHWVWTNDWRDCQHEKRKSRSKITQQKTKLLMNKIRMSNESADWRLRWHRKCNTDNHRMHRKI